ncbi:putative alpha-glucosidase [Nymphon striatum]|nr:putative alpha-glucosidase [Nymphon striatum]
MTMNANIDLNSVLAADKDWWRGAVIYQIYPRSYQDSDGDGVGDLKGIAQRLPYIASLGVDAIWISPFFTSPMKDFGYDVSDYCDVDPMFGTLADFDTVVETAHRLGIRIMIDLVLSHTSDQHPWFAQSRSSRDNDKSNWYVWSDPNQDGTPPNNWLSIFGGSAWHWDARREQYYMHNFLASQPDLNFHEPQVQDALLDATRFWLERGVDGFRLDTINFYFHDAQLRSNPALPKDQRNDTIAPSVNPYNHQEHLYSKNQPENLDFLRRFRSLLDEYPATAAVGEVGDAQRGLEILGEYTAGNEFVHMCYAFEFLSKDPLTAARIKEVFDRFDAVAPTGWACWAFSNHDVERHYQPMGAVRSRTTLLYDTDDVLARIGLHLSRRRTRASENPNPALPPQWRKLGNIRGGNGMANLKLTDVGKTYGGTVEVLKHIDLDIQQGELIVFVGPSGCGKSTLLRMIAGLEKISNGVLEIDGQPEIDAAVEKAARILQLDPYLDRLPKALSGGQRQRVAIGRSIVRDPKVYLFDEPLSNLDAALRVATRIEIAQLKENMPDSTMIYVTHDQVEAMTLASRIVVLANKGVAQVGTPLELYERPNGEFVAQFIGSPAMNLLPGKVIATGEQTTVQMDGGGTAVSHYPTQPDDMGLQVNVGVRPEDLTAA